MRDVVPFDFKGFDVRVVIRDGEPWFVASDVASALGYDRPNDAVRTHCKAVNTTVIRRSNKRGNPNIAIIPERDVYRLIMRSKLPAAEKFEEWVVGEVLPSIRKTGGYQMTRTKSKEYRRLFTDTLKLAGYSQPRQYQHTTIEMKRELGFPWTKKDDLTEGELRLVMAAELIATEKINRERLDGFDTVHPACVTSSNGVRGLIEARA